MRLIITLIIVFSTLVLPKAEAKRKPSWVKQRPVGTDYYVGIAMAKKGDAATDYMTEVRSRALKQMVSEIEVNISSNSILSQFENNYQVNQRFESNIQESVEATIEGYEVQTWENRKEYWVMVRLNKKDYAMRKQQKLDFAKRMCANYYYDAQKAVNNGDVYQGLLYYAQAIKAIKAHVAEDLVYRDINGSLNLGVDLFTAIQNVFKAVDLQAEQSSYNLEFNSNQPAKLNLTAYFTNSEGTKLPIANLPLNYSFEKGEGELSASGITNKEGKGQCNLHELETKRKNISIKAVFSLNNIIKGEDEENKTLLQAFFLEEYLPTTYFNIEIKKSLAYIEISEMSLGKKINNGTFGKQIRSELSQSYFNITDKKEEADFYISIETDFVKGSEHQGAGYAVYIVFANYYMSILDLKSNEEIFADGFTGLKAMEPQSYNHALNSVKKSALNKVISEVFPKMEQVNF